MSAARFVGQIRMASRVLDVCGRPLVMGVLNVTPDSFSDGGDFFEPDAAVRQAERMIRQGADIIDVGGESTRPGSQPTPADEQIRRTVPVLERIRARDRQIVLSIDTRCAAVARAGLEAGADMVNDISALRDDPAMAELVARRGAAVVLMHMKGTPATMQNRPVYRDVVAEVCQFLQQRVAAAVAAGIRRQSIVIDPGIGFGKTTKHNLQLLG
ncbi:MAG: dihydropteroate synthase, partial [Phycisphaerae bacterium]